MTFDHFSKAVDEQLNLCGKVLGTKTKEYVLAGTDRLRTFKLAATIQGITQKQALLGMLTKHVLSIYDMCNSEKDFPTALWTEKIGDAINYLLILKAIVVEETGEESNEKI